MDIESFQHTIVMLLKHKPGLTASRISVCTGHRFTAATVRRSLQNLRKNGVAVYDRKSGWRLVPSTLPPLPDKSKAIQEPANQRIIHSRYKDNETGAICHLLRIAKELGTANEVVVCTDTGTNQAFTVPVDDFFSGKRFTPKCAESLYTGD